jgi:hypothetical protein
MSGQVNATAPVAEAPRKRRFGLTAVVAIVVLFLLVIVGGGDWVVQIPYYLVFGWFGFLRENLVALQPNARLIMEALLCLAALGVGSHYFCRWLYAAMAPDAAVAWRARWTVMGVGLLFLLFAAGIGTIGLTHQAAWLIGARESFLRDYFSDRMRVSEALLTATPLRTEIAEEFARSGTLPDAVAAVPPIPQSPRNIVESISVAKGGVITIALKKNFADGSSVTLTPTVVEGKLEWKCSAPLARRMLPSACR